MAKTSNSSDGQKKKNAPQSKVLGIALEDRNVNRKADKDNGFYRPWDFQCQ